MVSSLPRVTEILAAVGLGVDYGSIPQAALANARTRGIDGHAAIEAHHYGYLEGDAPAGYLAFLAETRHQPIVSEVEVVHDRWGYRGHLDRVGWLAGVRGIFDWKFTETASLLEWSRQLAAYQAAWNHQHPVESVRLCVVVQFTPDGRYRLHEIDISLLTRGLRVFQAACVVWHERNGNGNGNDRPGA